MLFMASKLSLGTVTSAPLDPVSSFSRLIFTPCCSKKFARGKATKGSRLITALS